MPHRWPVSLRRNPAGNAGGQPNRWRTVHAFCHRRHRRLRRSPSRRPPAPPRPARSWTRSNRRASSSVASTPGLRASPIPTTPATGRASTSTSAAPSLRRYSAMPRRSSSRRSPPRSGSPPLQSGEVDVLSRNTTWTLNRDSAQGLDFVGVTYYDGQGFMVPKSLGVKSALELDGASVCVQTGTTTELNLADYFRANNMSYTPVVFERGDEARTAYEQGRCDTLTTDQSGLYAERIGLSNPDDHIVLPEVISKEPLGPVVRHGDNAVGRRRPLDALCHGRRRGARRHLAERRRLEGQLDQPGGPPAAGRRGRHGARASACPTTGGTRRSSRSATTARSSSATSAWARRSRSSAA